MSRGELSAAGRAASLRHPLSKVPEVTVYFWITKVLTTGMGEATSDYLVRRINPKIAFVRRSHHRLGWLHGGVRQGRDGAARHTGPGGPGSR